MSNPIQSSRCNLGIAKHTDPFFKIQIGCDDNTGRFTELTEQMKEQSST